MQVEPTQGQNPENSPENSTITFSGIIRKNEKLNNKKDLFLQCRGILMKNYETRFPAENNILLRLLEKSQFLKEMSQNISLDFVKGIFRNAKIEIIEQRQVIAEEDQDLDYMVIVLDGKLGIQKPSFFIPTRTIDSTKVKEGKQTIDPDRLKDKELFQSLTMLAKKEREAERVKSKLQRKSSMPVSCYNLSLPILTADDYEEFCGNLAKEVKSNESFGGRERLKGTSYKNRVVALERTTIMVIEMPFLFYWLEFAFKTKLAKNIQLFKNISAFENIEEDKMAEVILNMKLINKKRNDIVYEQGDAAQLLYILLEGELKLTKKANLFKENPNDFYVDRRKLVKQLHKDEKKYLSKSLKKEEDILPFANFTTLYNYRPMKKIVQLGVISSFGLFGQEEIIFNTPRETTVTVNSLETAYYVIDFKRLIEILGVKYADIFKSKLQQNLSKKVLYRQSEFADHIGFLNKTNMNYFFIDNEKQKLSPRKVKLQKLNERLAPKTARDESSHAPPLYTTFNFSKMLTSRRYSEAKKPTHKKTTNESSSQSLMSTLLNSAEEKMVQFSHSWNPIEKKVKQQRILSRRISPCKHQINIQSPLIDQQYFRAIAKESQRINKEFRTARMSLGRKNK